MANLAQTQVFISGNTGISPGHHCYFSSADAALAFFNGKKIAEWDSINVVRKQISKHGYNVSSVHVQQPLSALENAEYVSYFNAAVSNVWFHNRILEIEFVNQNSSRIHFVIDNYATYIGYAKLGYAFVERGHVRTSEDLPGRYLIQEDISLPIWSEKVDCSTINAAAKPLQPDVNHFFIYSSTDEYSNTNVAEIGVQNYCGVPAYTYAQYGPASETEIFLKTFANCTSTMQSMQKPMLDFITAVKCQPVQLMDTSAFNVTVQYQPGEIGYRFKKCLAPQFYNYKIFALSSGSNIYFDILSSNTPTPNVTVYTFTLRACGGMHGKLGLHLDRGQGIIGNAIQHVEYPDLFISAHSQGTYSTFGKEDKLVYQPAAAGLKAGAQAAESITGLIPAVDIAEGAVAAGESLYQGSKAVMGTGDSIKATVTSTAFAPDYAIAQGLYNFEVIRYRPTDSGAQTLDSYFSTWGYRLSENRAIALNIRANFTYVKTVNANVTGNIPQSAAQDINNMLNAGCTFWQVPIGSTWDCGA